MSLLLLALMGVALPRAQEPTAPAPLAAVSISELREHPSRWLGHRVRLVVQFQEPRASRDRYFSRFSSRTYWGFQAWGDEQALWERADFDDPAPRLFARRGTSAELRLRAARRYERFELVALVEEVFLGEPWIEVESVRRLDASWNEGALVHATRAGALLESGRWHLAADQFERAMLGGLPEQSMVRLGQLRDRCHLLNARGEELRRRGLSSFGTRH